jgi:hypothetical protein
MSHAGETWVLAFRYPTMDAAKVGWKRVRDLILAYNCDASVYRSQINGLAHVVIAGWETVPDELRRRFSEECSSGLRAEIPEAVRSYLIERRNKSAIPGAFWERLGTS